MKCGFVCSVFIARVAALRSQDTCLDPSGHTITRCVNDAAIYTTKEITAQFVKSKILNTSLLVFKIWV